MCKFMLGLVVLKVHSEVSLFTWPVHVALDREKLKSMVFKKAMQCKGLIIHY